LDDTHPLSVDFATKSFYLFKEFWRSGLRLNVHLDTAILINPYQALFLRRRRGVKTKQIEEPEVEFGMLRTVRS
jgi:hypothetical protein